MRTRTARRLLGLLALTLMAAALADNQPPSLPGGTHDGTVFVVVRTSDNLILTGSFDGTIKLLDFNVADPSQSGGVIKTYADDKQEMILTVAADPSNRFIASGGRDGSVRVWRRIDRPLQTVTQATGATVLAIHPSGLVAYADGGVHLVNQDKAKNSGSDDSPKKGGDVKKVTALAWSDKVPPRWLVAGNGDKDGTLWVWKDLTQAPTSYYLGGKGDILALQFTTKSDLLVFRGDGPARMAGQKLRIVFRVDQQVEEDRHQRQRHALRLPVRGRQDHHRL